MPTAAQETAWAAAGDTPVLSGRVANGLAQVSAIKDAFNIGVRLSIDVLNTQGQAYVIRPDLTCTAVNTLIAQLRLKAAVGTLGEDTVVVINHLLEKQGT